MKAKNFTLEMSNCDTENQVSLEEIEEIGETLKNTIQAMDTLEIFQVGSPIHVAFKTEQSNDIESFSKFSKYTEGDELMNAHELNVCYKNIQFAFNRVSQTSDYNVFLLISKENINGEKAGMIVLADMTGVIFIATCKASILRQFNLDFLSAIYP